MSGRVEDQGACNTVCPGNCPEETVNLPSPHPKQIVGGDLSRTGLGRHPGMRFAQVKTVILPRAGLGKCRGKVAI